MLNFMEVLYQSWVGTPNPKQWPDHLKDKPVDGHGIYSFHRGLRLGIALAFEALSQDCQL